MQKEPTNISRFPCSAWSILYPPLVSFYVRQTINSKLLPWYHSPPLIRTPLVCNNSVLIREVSFGEREHHMYTQNMLPRNCALSRVVSSLRVSFKRGTTLITTKLSSKLQLLNLWDRISRSHRWSWHKAITTYKVARVPAICHQGPLQTEVILSNRKDNASPRQSVTLSSYLNLFFSDPNPWSNLCIGIEGSGCCFSISGNVRNVWCIHDGLYFMSGDTDISCLAAELGSTTGAYFAEPTDMHTVGGMYTYDQS